MSNQVQYAEILKEVLSRLSAAVTESLKITLPSTATLMYGGSEIFVIDHNSTRIGTITPAHGHWAYVHSDYQVTMLDFSALIQKLNEEMSFHIYSNIYASQGLDNPCIADL